MVTRRRPGLVGAEGEKPPEWIFVGGPERSGTTLLQNMLDCHPAISGAPEFMHLPAMMGLRNDMHRSVQEGWIDQFCDHGQVDEAFRDLVLEFFRRFRAKYPCEILSEKTPANVLVFRELLDLFEDSRCLFMVRDPRGVVCSLLEVGEREREHGRTPRDFTRELEAAMRRVRRCLGAGMEALERVPNRIGLVQYERLVREPESETKRICDFLSIPWNDAMLHPEEQEHPGEKAIVNNIWYDLETFYSAPDPSRIGRWREGLTPVQKVAVTRAFRGDPWLGDLGYDLSSDEMGRGERVAGIIGAVARRLRRALGVGRN